jgi:hypothetical protein
LLASVRVVYTPEVALSLCDALFWFTFVEELPSSFISQLVQLRLIANSMWICHYAGRRCVGQVQELGIVG